jgi:hypothetical protein
MSWLADAIASPATTDREAVTSNGNIPLGMMAREFVKDGAPLGEQRDTAVRVARNYWGAGVDEDEAVEAIWQGLQQNNDPERDPWTWDEARAIVRSVYTSDPPPLKEIGARIVLNGKHEAAGVSTMVDAEPRPLADLLDAVRGFLARFVAYPDAHTLTAHTLWIAHTHAMAAWTSTPRIAFLSPEPGSGKTRALEATELLVPRPVAAVNVTPAYLFRKVADKDGLPTILYDEIDTVFGPKAKDNEEIRGLLNAGHRRGAVAGRCVVKGKLVETEEIPAYCAVALAGLGGLPDTLLSRSVIVRMKRRAPNETVEAFRRRVHEVEGHRLRDELAVWGQSSVEVLGEAWPEMPPTVTDRNADIWEPLLAVADAAGGDWPAEARCSAVALVAASMAGTPSLGVRLLSDVRQAIGEADAISTGVLLGALHKIEDAPWAELRGKPLDNRGLARRLKQYDITPTNIRVGDAVVKGYRRADFTDAFARYLSPLGSPPYVAATSATPLHPDGADAIAEVLP